MLSSPGPPPVWPLPLHAHQSKQSTNILFLSRVVPPSDTNSLLANINGAGQLDLSHPSRIFASLFDPSAFRPNPSANLRVASNHPVLLIDNLSTKTRRESASITPKWSLRDSPHPWRPRLGGAYPQRPSLPTTSLRTEQTALRPSQRPISMLSSAGPRRRNAAILSFSFSAVSAASSALASLRRAMTCSSSPSLGT